MSAPVSEWRQVLASMLRQSLLGLVAGFLIAIAAYAAFGVIP